MSYLEQWEAVVRALSESLCLECGINFIVCERPYGISKDQVWHLKLEAQHVSIGIQELRCS